MSATLLERFSPRANGLNLIRLLLAVGVILWHSFPITGRQIEWAPLRQLASEFGVDGFFAISGFLILASWERSPNIRTFLIARILRIFPAFWVCLIITAFIVAPLALLMQGLPPFSVILSGDSFRYVFQHFLLWGGDFDIGGSPAEVPYPHVWNGSLWTLAWEFFCYLGLMIAGVLGILRNRFSVEIAFALVWLAAIAREVLSVESFYAEAALRFALMFLSGMLIFRHQSQLRVNRYLLAVAAALVGASAFLADYRLLSALPIAYLLIGASTYIRLRGLQFRTDISYGMYIYAFPIQQTLVVAGLGSLSVPIFWSIATCITATLAWLSWSLVERRSLLLKSRARISQLAPEAHTGAGDDSLSVENDLK